MSDTRIAALEYALKACVEDARRRRNRRGAERAEVKAPKTQWAWARMTDYGLDAQTLEPEVIGAVRTPVLVVPEAAVKGCRHEDTVGVYQEFCLDCGAYRERGGRGPAPRWQRPRILRVKR